MPSKCEHCFFNTDVGIICLLLMPTCIRYLCIEKMWMNFPSVMFKRRTRVEWITVITVETSLWQQWFFVTIVWTSIEGKVNQILIACFDSNAFSFPRLILALYRLLILFSFLISILSKHINDNGILLYIIGDIGWIIMARRLLATSNNF